MTVATLSSSLLARKGTARPSAIAQPAGPWPAPAVAPAQPGAGRSDDRARISLRLDPARHRRLRLAAAHLDCSLQDLLIAALDGHLNSLDLGCACVEGGLEDCSDRCTGRSGDGPKGER